MGEPKGRSFISRKVDDENFPHVVGMMGAAIAWAESVERGQKISLNEINMIHLPAEVLLALLVLHRTDPSPLGEACDKAIRLLEDFRRAFTPAKQPSPSHHRGLE